MARIFEDGFEFGSLTTPNNNWASSAGTAALSVAATHAQTGTYGLKVSGLTSATASYLSQVTAGTGINRNYVKIAIYPVTFPGVETTIFRMFSASNGAAHYVTLSSDGKLRLYNNISALIGAASPALSANTWSYFEVFVNPNPASGSRVIEAKLNGTVWATNSSQTTGVVSAVTELRVGGNIRNETATACEYWLDDIVWNDANGTVENTYPGDQRIIRLLPNAAGDSNTFGTQTGGTAGSANNYTRVNDALPDGATSFNGSVTLNALDLFNLADTGLSGPTINAVSILQYFANGTAADATTAITFQAKAHVSGTVASSAAFVSNSTTYGHHLTATQGPANAATSSLIMYADPDAAAWTTAVLDALQLGYKITAANVNPINVSALSLHVSYVGGTAADNAAVAQTLAALTQAAAGTAIDAAAVAQALGALTQSAAGTAIDAAVVAQTLAGLTQALTGAVIDVAATTEALGGLSQAATGAAVDAAATTEALGPLGQAGAITASDAALVAQALPGLIQAATGGAVDVALYASTLGGIAQAATGTSPDAAAAAQVLASIVQAVTGTAIDAGTVAQALDGLDQATTGAVIDAAALDQALGPLGQSAMSSDHPNAKHVGALGDLGQVATGNVFINATIAQALVGLAQIASGTEASAALAAQLLFALGQATTGEAPVAGAASQALAALQQAASATGAPSRGFVLIVGSLDAAGTIKGSLDEHPTIRGQMH